MTNIELIREVKRNAVNHWSGILPACGVDVPERGKHGACPVLSVGELTVFTLLMITIMAIGFVANVMSLITVMD